MKKAILIISAIALTIALTSGKISNKPMQQGDDKPTIYYVLFHSPGAKWVSGVSFQEQPGVMEHVKYMAGFVESKKLVEGVPFLDNSGGMMVFNGTKEEAEKIANADPAVKAGLLKVTVKPWMVAMSSK
jgi:uncharacterized protein YciI